MIKPAAVGNRIKLRPKDCLYLHNNPPEMDHKDHPLLWTRHFWPITRAKTRYKKVVPVPATTTYYSILIWPNINLLLRLHRLFGLVPLLELVRTARLKSANVVVKQPSQTHEIKWMHTSLLHLFGARHSNIAYRYLVCKVRPYLRADFADQTRSRIKLSTSSRLRQNQSPVVI